MKTLFGIFQVIGFSLLIIHHCNSVLPPVAGFMGPYTLSLFSFHFTFASA